VIDFYCAELNLEVEIDGTVHDSPEAKEQDLARTSYLEARGLHVVRFDNAAIETNVGGALEKLRAFLSERSTLSPALSLTGRGSPRRSHTPGLTG
jgi:very-short-patch-repair endonuclease